MGHTSARRVVKSRTKLAARHGLAASFVSVWGRLFNCLQERKGMASVVICERRQINRRLWEGKGRKRVNVKRRLLYRTVLRK